MFGFAAANCVQNGNQNVDPELLSRAKQMFLWAIKPTAAYRKHEISFGQHSALGLSKLFSCYLGESTYFQSVFELDVSRKIKTYLYVPSKQKHLNSNQHLPMFNFICLKTRVKHSLHVASWIFAYFLTGNLIWTSSPIKRSIYLDFIQQ